MQSERKVAEQVGQLSCRRGVLVAAALDDVGDRLRAGQRRHRDRPGQPPPRLVPRGDDDVAVHGGGQVGLQPGGLVGVVEHQQPARGAVQLGPQRGARVLRTRPRADAKGRGQVGQARRRARRVLGRDPPRHAARPLPSVRQLAGQLGLPAPGMPYSTTGRRAASSSADSTTRGQLGALDEHAGPLRQVRPERGTRGADRAERLLGEHRRVHAAQRRGRVHPELIRQRPTAALVGGERVGLPPPAAYSAITCRAASGSRRG